MIQDLKKSLFYLGHLLLFTEIIRFFFFKSVENISWTNIHFYKSHFEFEFICIKNISSN